MGLYLRFLSICYLIGFGLHVADLFGVRLSFSEMDLIWKSWIVYLTVADFLAAIFLWLISPIGIWLFLLISTSQLVAYIFFQDIFGQQWPLVIFHSVTIVLLFLIPSLRTQIDLAKAEKPTGQPRAVGTFFKMLYAHLFRGISFNEAAWRALKGLKLYREALWNSILSRHTRQRFKLLVKSEHKVDIVDTDAEVATT